MDHIQTPRLSSSIHCCLRRAWSMIGLGERQRDKMVVEGVRGTWCRTVDKESVAECTQMRSIKQSATIIGSN